MSAKQVIRQQMAILGDRMAVLQELKDGWFNGDGLAPSGDGLSWLHEWMGKMITFFSAPCPFIYPTTDGGVSLEWDIGGVDFTIKVNLETRSAVITDGDDEKFARLSDAGNSKWIADRILELSGPVELSAPPCKPNCVYFKAPESMPLQRNALRVEVAFLSGRCGWKLLDGRKGGHFSDYDYCNSE